ncbi:FAD-dependent oxidoreductase [Treponema sp. OttesenSCG-928-L16]|nr:FAD-dependent oxidoreductase [Treponema sp. OttesenSCG-928-L16]
MKEFRLEYDAAVIGAGPGGIPAALALADMGIKVLLVEKNGYVGGNAALGLPWLAFLDKKGRQVIGGWAQKFVDELTARGASYGHRTCPMHNSVTVIQPDVFKLVALEALKKSGVDLLLHCESIGAELENGTLRKVTVFGKGNRIDIGAKIFIDATGDGDIAYLAGCSYEMGQEGSGALQPPTVMFTLGGVHEEKFFNYLEENPDQLTYGDRIECGPGYDAAYFRGSENHVFVGLRKLLSELRERGECPIDRDTLIYINSPNPGEVYVNSTRLLNVDGTNIFDLTRGEIDGHLQIPKLIDVLKKYVPGFENCYLSNIAPNMGIRETRRFQGIKYLTADHIIRGEIPDDTIALGSYKIDIHSALDDSTIFTALENPFGIPYGCLVSKELKGLMFSGRLISMDAEVLGSTRIMPTCMAIGEAAGVGAALAIKHNIQAAEVDPGEVRNILLKNGAILS